MKGASHKVLGFILFSILYFFNLFPASINDYLNSTTNIFIALILVFLFSGGRFSGKSLWGFGLSPDIDYHKRMKRDWLFHSGIIPTILVILIPLPLVLIACFFYTAHVALDLLNIRSWEGNKYTYIAVYLTVILFYAVLYN
jgi:hypothetical protein